MHERNHNIGFRLFVSGANIGQHFVVVCAPGHAGDVVFRLERLQKYFAITEQGDPHAVAVNDPRFVGIGLVPTAAEIWNVGRIQPVALFDKCGFAEITRVVVGHGEYREVLLEKRDATRVGAKVIGLFYSFAFCSNDAFQVADRDVGIFE